MIRFYYKNTSSHETPKVFKFIDDHKFRYNNNYHYTGINISKLYISSPITEGWREEYLDDELLLYFDKDHKGYFNSENDFVLWKLKYGI